MRQGVSLLRTLCMSCLTGRNFPVEPLTSAGDDERKGLAKRVFLAFNVCAIAHRRHAAPCFEHLCRQYACRDTNITMMGRVCLDHTNK